MCGGGGGGGGGGGRRALYMQYFVAADIRVNGQLSCPTKIEFVVHVHPCIYN